MKIDQQTNLMLIAEHYGKSAQLAKTQEELGECIAAIARFIAKPTDLHWDQLIGEIADSYIMLDQITHLLSARMAVEHVRATKISRQLIRIQLERKHGQE